MPEEEQERKADDDRRQCERQVDERVEEPLARDPVPHDRERAGDAEDRVRGHGDHGDQNRDHERVLRRRRRDRLPGGAEAVLECPPEDHRDRQDEEQSEVAERR